MKKSKLSKYIILGAIAALVATFILPKKEIHKGHPRDYAEIAADGTLHAATEYNSISFMWTETPCPDFITIDRGFCP